MKVMIIYAHPYEGSYNKAILDHVMEGLKKAKHTIDLLDLNEVGFNPVMTKEDLYQIAKEDIKDKEVLSYQKRIEDADHIYFIFPIWYESMPAIMKGFIDKVFTKGWAYKTVENKKLPVGQLTHLKATVISTSGAPKLIYRLLYNNAIQGVLIKGTLKFSGIKKIKWFMIDNIQTISDASRVSWLKKIKNYSLAIGK